MTDRVPGGLEAELRSLMRHADAEAEAERQEIEYETDRAEVKRQDLADRAVWSMMSGERWRITFGRREVEGQIVHVGQNFVGLQDGYGNLHDVVLAAAGPIRVVETRVNEGRAPTTFRPATFRARLLGLEQSHLVELSGGGGLWAVTGVVESVNHDHLELTEPSGNTCLTPIDVIDYLGRPATDPRTRQRRPTHQR